MTGVTVSLRPTTTASRAVEILDGLINDLSTVTNGSAQEVFDKYLAWAATADRMLRPAVSSEDLERLVHTRRHWTLCEIEPAVRPGYLTTIQAEFAYLRDVLEAERQALTATRDHWANAPGALVVPDTNLLIHHPDPLDIIDWPGIAHESRVEVVVPMLVVDELDKRKRHQGRDANEVRARARATLRFLNTSFEDPRWAVTLHPNTVSVHLLLDPPRHVRLPDNDSEIVERAVALKAEAGRQVSIATYDTGMALRARAAELDSIHLGHDADTPSG